MRPAEQNEAVIRRFYDELWNRWRLEVADEILSSAVRFRGSLGSTHEGRDDFKRYVEDVRAAFPDWHNQVNEILAVDDRVVTRMIWSGTHRGPLGNIEPTDAHVEFAGAAFFRLKEGLIEEAWVVGDTQELWRALGAPRGSESKINPGAPVSIDRSGLSTWTVIQSRSAWKCR